MLKISNLCSYYGKLQVLKGINISIEDGNIVALLGPNGAGKTTTMMSISGLVKMSPDSHISLDGKELTGQKPEAIVRHGVIHVPQGRGIFPGLTVHENLIMGAYLRKSRKEIEKDISEVIEMFPRLKERYKQLAGTLSGGEQQMLAIMRGLMAKPKLLMLDEPSMGLAPVIVEQIYESILKINKSGMTVFLVEQNTNMALEVANYGYVLSSGMIASEGSSCELRGNEEMLQSYFKGQEKA
jgi:ABC-type branched-chain amino acid transport systems, ATPase component